LTLPPAVASDATDFNWKRKRDLFAASRLYVAVPSRWLMDRAQRSMLAPAVVESRLIPAPLDTRCFRAAPKAEARAALGLPQNSHILVFAAFQARSNPYKDYATVEAAVQRLAEQMPDEDILCVAIGEEAPELRRGKLRIQFRPFQPQGTLIRYYQAADVYLHAAKEENFGLVVAEAQACGTPVVATGVGGLPEVVADGQRGLIVPPGDAHAMAAAVHRLLTDTWLCHRLGRQAADYARRNWEQEVILNSILAWCEDVLVSSHAVAA
jgi:glycosyltransferase involved in cell wall biosynthesis